MQQKNNSPPNTQDSEQNLNMTLAADSAFPDGSSKSFLPELPFPLPLSKGNGRKTAILQGLQEGCMHF